MEPVFQVDDRTAIELRVAAKECSERGLIVAKKWCALLESLLSVFNGAGIRASELVLALLFSKRNGSTNSDPQHIRIFSTSTPAQPKFLGTSVPFPDAPSPMSSQVTMQTSEPAITAHPAYIPRSDGQPTDVRRLEIELENQDADLLCAAHAFIESREFSRAIHILRDGRSAKARFVRIYSKFMVSTSSTLDMKTTTH
jgi:anaphase-promoting complex subunit 8